MELKRFENSKRNLIFGVINRGTLILFPFINRTIILYLLGEGYLGLNGLFTSILSVLSLTELGFGSALVFCMYKPIAENDEATICALLKLCRKIYRVIGTIILLVGGVALLFLDYLISGDVPAGINIRIIFLIQLLDTVLSYFLFAYKSSLLSAFQREDVISKITVTTTVVQYLVQFLLVWLFRNYYLYLIVVPIMTIANNLLRLWTVNKLFPQYRCEGTLAKAQVSVLQTKVKALFMHKIGGVIANSLDNVIVSAYLGLTMVAVFGNYMYVFSSVCGLMNVFYTAILAGVGNSVVCESTEKNYKNFIQLTVINLWMTAWCAITMLCLYQPFMRLWAGEHLMFEMDAVILLVVYFYINLSRRIVVVYKDATGNWENDQLMPIVSGLVNVIINIVLIQLIGVNGVIISTIIAFAVVEIPWQLWTLYRIYFKGYSVGKYLGIQALFAALTLIIALITFRVANLVWIEGLLGIILKGVVCIIVPNVLFLVAIGKKAPFIWEYLRRVIKKG